MKRLQEVRGKPLRAVAVILALGVVSGCAEGPGMAFLQPKQKTLETAGKPMQSTRLVERDVEAPEMFQVTEAGLWDGRPSFGGVWVAYPDVKAPQRVIIRNSANDKFVIGAMFPPLLARPGPRIQASSDAAAALGMLAGAPVELNVTALIREAVPEEKPMRSVIADAGGEIAESTLDPVAGVAAAIDATDPDRPAVAAAAPAPARPKPASLGKPFIQIGIFSVRANAERSADLMRSAGMVPTMLAQSYGGKDFWRVVIGPAQSKSERDILLKKARETGFSDAYFVAD